METTIKLSISLVSAYIIAVLTIPTLKKVAVMVNLTDKPNSRKLHVTPVPLIGGIAVAITLSTVSVVNYKFLPLATQPLIFSACSLSLLLLGVVDDKLDISAKYKLLFQLLCSFIISYSGTRVTSLYGVFGIYEIPLHAQYIFTMLLITGVVNAFNLMDGIDGLIGSLGIIGFTLLGIFSFVTNNYALSSVCVASIGALVGFLKFNLKKEKIFMGDAGSLFIGNMLICSGIYLLNSLDTSAAIHSAFLYSTVGFFALPVLDSVRVYLGRIKKGKSPFSADKSHLHHLLLLLGLSHKQISIVVSLIILVTLTLTSFFVKNMSLAAYLLTLVSAFSLMGFVLNLNKKLSTWTEQLKDLERQC